MRSFIRVLADQRRKFLEGLDANEGDINLDIFEDFYPDRAHFIYELLQNAEDAEATEASFELSEGVASFEHNGRRAFSESDIRAITGIHNSAKSKSPDKIGKFGVGFKSVFVYTLTPVIHTGDVSFRICRLVLPEIVACEDGIRSRTRFDLPFNNPKKSPDEAFREIEGGLNGLAETTLLFLTGLESIRWKIGQDAVGEIRRIPHSDNHIEILKQVGGKTTSRSHFLRVSETVTGLERHRVAIAFVLEPLSDATDFDSGQPLAKQLRIVPAAPGRVAVFFPAEKETSGLRFHLHAPFVPELSRASIKETPANQPLFGQLAQLAAKALHRIREFGFLNTDFLGVLPNLQDDIPPRYQPIRDAVIEEMNEKPLTPTYRKDHAPAKGLIQARASLKDLLSVEDLHFLISGKSLDWAVAASQRHSDADRFLLSLQIGRWDVENFVDLLASKASDERCLGSSTFKMIDGPDSCFMQWLSSKSVEWHQSMYAVLAVATSEGSEMSRTNTVERLKKLRIVRVGDGSYMTGSRCYFPDSDAEHDDVLPRVCKAVYSSGKSTTQQDDAKRLLQRIGVREIGEAEQVQVILKRDYIGTVGAYDERMYFRHLSRFVALVEREPKTADLFKDACILATDEGLRSSTSVYLDEPYEDTELRSYYGALDGVASKLPLSPLLADCGVPIERLAAFARAVGVQTQLKVIETSCSDNPEYLHLISATGRRNSNATDKDWTIPHLRQLLQTPTVALAKLVWRTMCRVPNDYYSLHPAFLYARYQQNASRSPNYARSQLVCVLRDSKWIPQTNGQFVCPCDASRQLLPDGFAFDGGYSWLKAIGFGEKCERQAEAVQTKEVEAASMGFGDVETLNRAREFAALPPAEQERVLSEYKQRQRSEFPSRRVGDHARRQRLKDEQHEHQPDKEYERQNLSVRTSKDAPGAREYLRAMYADSDAGEVFCQLCRRRSDDASFRKLNDEPYFEAVEFLSASGKEDEANHLLLCPVCAAKFKELVKSRYGQADSQESAFIAVLQSMDLGAADENELVIRVTMRDLPESLRFVEQHWSDLRVIADEASSKT